jgi:Tfp pilus assembly protein PilX
VKRSLTVLAGRRSDRRRHVGGTLPARTRWVRDRLREQHGFTMIVALGVLMVSTLLTAAVLLSVQGDSGLTRADLDGKRAYAAAQSAVQAYMYQLNNSTNYWNSCTNDTLAETAVPGTTTGIYYSWAPVPANGYTACSTTNTISSLIDNTTGTLRMEFTGYSRSISRTIVASFGTVTPLKFLWYTVHETADASTQGCGVTAFYYNGTIPSQCQIVWASGDKMNGPMYTQDQYLIQQGGTPAFGRSSQDAIASQVPTTGANDICVSSNCQSASIVGKREPDVSPEVPLPSSNSALSADANKYGQVFTGTTTLTISGTTASGWNCPGTSSSSACTSVSINLATHPIIYVANASGCTPSYAPTSVSYQTTTNGVANNSAYFGPCGDIYVSGSYTTPLTIAAADDIILTGSLTTTEDANGNPTGTATLGLVAGYYVRVKHTCSGNPNVTIDGAILTLNNSFFVDNYNCGGTPLGQLTVHGAIAQKYRGIVGTVNSSGYLKNYNYDDRLQYTLPPYLFALTNFSWSIFRETLCSPSASASSSMSCAYTGS